MKVVHVIEALIVNSGVTVFASEIASAQAKAGHSVTLFYIKQPNYVVDSRVNVRQFKGFGELRNQHPDIVHIHAFWSLDMARVMSLCRREGIPYVVSPHGGLMPRVLLKGWVKKHLFYWLYLSKNLRCAKAIHCTGEGEVDAVRHLGIATPTFIAPLGCHLPQWPVQRVVAENKTLLFLSRISEEKGLVYLLDAWKSIPHDGWRFVVAGPDWRGYKRTLEEKISADSIDAVEFVGAADATLKDRLYRQADAFVLPSPMENFSMVVLDALAYGLPVVCTKGTPWRAIQENCCGWWIEPKSSSALADALMSVMNLSLSDVQKVRENARRLAERYSWDLISKGVLANYE